MTLTGIVAALAPPETLPMILLSGILAACLALSGRAGAWRRPAAITIVLLAAIEASRSVPVNGDVLPYTDHDYRDMFAAKPALDHAKLLADPGRVYATELFGVPPTSGKLGTLYRIPVFSDYDSLIPARYREWDERMTGHAHGADSTPYHGSALFAWLPTFDPRFLDYAAVKEVVFWNLDRSVPLPACIRGMTFNKESEALTPDEVGARDAITTSRMVARIYGNPYAWPRAFLAREVQAVASGAAALDLMAKWQRGIAPRAVVELQQGTKLPPGASEEGGAVILASEVEHIVIQTKSPREALLVLSDTYFPGWKADVDGVWATILRTNFLFRGVVVPGGSHRVTFRYDPSSVRMGMILGGLGWVIVIILAGVLLARSRRCRRASRNAP